MHAFRAILALIDGLNESFGRLCAWLTLIMVLLQFIIVGMRYFFGLGSIQLQEGLMYLHAAVFLIGAGYTLKHNGHVRVDVIYREASPRTKAIVNLFGSLLFLLPVCGFLLWVAWPYVSYSWSIRESSVETSGLPFVYIQKSFMIGFAVLLLLQGISMAGHAVLVLLGHESSGEEAAAEV